MADGYIRVDGWSPEVQPGEVTLVTVEDRQAAEAAASAAAGSATQAANSAAAATQAALNANAAKAQAENAVSGTGGALDALVAALITNPASATRAAIIGLAGSGGAGGGGRVDYVYLTVDGWPARPTSSTEILVIWIGGDDQPAGMIGHDLWLQGGDGIAPGDVAAPSVPAGLTWSAITSTGFTLSWTASTDNVAVTGYQVRLSTDDGVTWATIASPSGVSQAVGGLSAEQTVWVAVRARDAAGNWSAWSNHLEVKTSASNAAVTHSVFGSAAYPYTLVKNTDGSPTITVANGFYTYGGTVGGWKVAGARIYVPAGVSMPSTATVKLYMPASGAPDLASPTVSKVLSGITTGWNDVLFDAPLEVVSGRPFWVGYDFGDGSYLAIGSGGPEAYVAAHDSSPLVLAEAMINGTVGGTFDNTRRNYFRIGTGPTGTGGASTAYGIDVIVQED